MSLVRDAALSTVTKGSWPCPNRSQVSWETTTLLHPHNATQEELQVFLPVRRYQARTLKSRSQISAQFLHHDKQLK